MIKVSIKPEEITQAHKESDELDAIKTYEKFNCKNNFIGRLGEIVFERFLHDNQIPHITVSFVKKGWEDEDFVIDGKKVDIKTTFDTKLWFQKPVFDIYIFTRLNDDMKELFIISYIKKAKLERLISEGKLEIIKREDRQDYVVMIEQMSPIEELLKVKIWKQ